MKQVLQAIREWRARRAVEREMDDEFRFHLEMAVEAHMRRGLGREEAQRRALLEFGGVERHKDDARDLSPAHRAEQLAQDLRYAFRTLRRSPAFTASVLLTLVLGIAGTSAMFSIVNAVLLRPLPFPRPHEVVFLGWDFGEGRINFNLTGFQVSFLRDHARTIAGITTFRARELDLDDPAAGRTLRGLQVTDDFFRVIGATPIVGRAFTPEEQQPGGPRSIVLGYDLWQREFAGSPSIVGRQIRLEDETYQVVGVMPSFQFPSAPDQRDFIAPLQFRAERRDEGHNYEAIARLRPGTTREQLDADLAAAFATFRSEHPDLANARERFVPLSFQDLHVRNLRTTLWVLFGAVVCLLLIACANCANLLVARSVARQRELVVRTALGASRRRLVRQLLTEGLALSTIAGAIGTAAGLGLLRVLLAISPRALPRASEIGIDGRVVLVTGGIVVVSGVLFGILAALPGARLNAASVLSHRHAGAMRARVRDALIAAETAIALVLLVCAALLATSFQKLRSVDPGFAIEGVTTVRFGKPPATYVGSARPELEQRLVERVRALPGVSAAGFVTNFPLERGLNLPVTVEGRPDRSEGSVQWRAIGDGALDALGLRLVQGRPFEDADFKPDRHVAIVSEAFVRHFFPGENPVGQRIEIGRFKGNWSGSYHSGTQIIGVVRDVRDISLDRAPRWTVYGPRGTGESSRPLLLVRGGDRTAIAQEVAAVVTATHPGMPLPSVRALEDIAGASIAGRRYETTIVVLFAWTGLTLTLIGIVGVVAYAVQRRTREIGIRVALGAHPDTVVRAVTIDAMRWVLAGTAIGVALSLGITRYLQGMLYEVRATDPRAFAATAAILLAVAGVACYFPARRAARVDPVTALRSE